MKLKKIIGIASNIISVIVYAPLCLYFFVLGLMLFSVTDLAWSIPSLLLLASSGIYLCTPFFCVIGIVLSIVLRKKEQYVFSYIIQLLPFSNILFGIFLTIISMILGN